MLHVADWNAMAAAWQALSKDRDSEQARALGLIIERAKQAIIDALTGVLDDLWRAAWDLGIRAAARLVGRALAASPRNVTEFLEGARDLLAAIADTLSNRLASVLADASGQDAAVTARELAQVAGSLDTGLLIAWAELARAQAAAAVSVYRDNFVIYAEWITEHDARVCLRCAANEAAGALLLGESYPSGNAWPPAHPRCRCALLPVEVARAA